MINSKVGCFYQVRTPTLVELKRHLVIKNEMKLRYKKKGLLGLEGRKIYLSALNTATVMHIIHGLEHLSVQQVS